MSPRPSPASATACIAECALHDSASPDNWSSGSLASTAAELYRRGMTLVMERLREAQNAGDAAQPGPSSPTTTASSQLIPTGDSAEVTRCCRTGRRCSTTFPTSPPNSSLYRGRRHRVGEWYRTGRVGMARRSPCTEIIATAQRLDRRGPPLHGAHRGRRQRHRCHGAGAVRGAGRLILLISVPRLAESEYSRRITSSTDSARGPLMAPPNLPAISSCCSRPTWPTPR